MTDIDMGKAQSAEGRRADAGRGDSPRRRAAAWNHVPTAAFPTARDVEASIGRELGEGGR